MTDPVPNETSCQTWRAIVRVSLNIKACVYHDTVSQKVGAYFFFNLFFVFHLPNTLRFSILFFGFLCFSLGVCSESLLFQASQGKCMFDFLYDLPSFWINRSFCFLNFRSSCSCSFFLFSFFFFFFLLFLRIVDLICMICLIYWCWFLV